MASDINPTYDPSVTTAETRESAYLPAAEPVAPEPARRRSRAAAFTVADGLMLLIGGLAAWLRFGDLARLPLSAAEATAALPNWQFWSAAPLDVAVSSPAYFAFTHLVMSLGAGGDAAARLVPAAFGLLTVLLVWLLRGQTRPVAWLTAGLFLAVSPLLVAVSRAAGGDAIALFALTLIAVSGRWTANPFPAVGRRRSAVLVGLGLGLGLASSPLFYTGLAALLVAVLAGKTGQLAEREEHNPEWWRHTGIAAGITLAVVSTSLLLFPAGLGAALRIFPEWLAQFSLPASASAAVSPWLALLRYEPAVFVLGLPAAVGLWLGGGRFARFLAAWFAGLLALVVLQSGVMVNAAAVPPAAYLLVGLLAASLAGRVDKAPVAGRRTAGFTAGAILGLGALMLAATGRFARLNLLSGENSMLIALAVVAFVLAGAAVVVAMAWESPAARRGAFVGVALLTLFWQWGASWQLSRLGANDPRERWVAAGTDDDVAVMVNLLGGISRQVSNSDRDLVIFSQVESPVLRWYLRDFAGFQSGPALPVNTQADVIIAPVESEPALPNDYFGADFGLEQREIPNVGPAMVSDALKWWLFRESTAATENRRVVVWVRSDLAAPQ